MEHDKILKLFAKAQSTTSVTRDEASEMLVFGRINAWDDDIGASILTEYRGSFPLIKGKRNRILAELWANPIDVTFKPKDGASPEAAEILNGMYRTDMLCSDEAIKTATTDQVDCGFGAWRLCTEYESKFNDLDNTQVIRRQPINEANNVVYFDANAKRQDKSDARWCMIISTFTEDGWEKYCAENGIDYEENKLPVPVASPNEAGTAYWRSDGDEIKVGEFYYKDKKRERVFLYEDPMGNVRAHYQREIKKVVDELNELGFEKVGEKLKDRWVVKKCIVSADGIIKDYRIPGEHIPVIPVYADWSRTEGRELWRGLYHDAQDPQRLHNMLMSYLADIVAKGPQEKDIYYPGQIAGFEYMYMRNGPDNNYPYMLQNEISEVTGQQYPLGPVGKVMPPQMPQALANLIGLMRSSVDDVTGGMMDTEKMMNSQVTEGQINAVNALQNMETFVFQDALALAMKQDGRVYASMAAELYDVPREVTITNPDGTETTETVMESVYDYETDTMVVANDLTKGSFEVYSDIGPKYSTLKQQTRQELREMIGITAGTPEGNMLMLNYLSMMDGPNMEDIRIYARRQLVLGGYAEPQDDEEIAMVQQAAQAQQEPSPDMVFAQAEAAKAQADIAMAQSRQMDSQTKQMDSQVKQFEAETRRMGVEIDAQKAGAQISKTQVEISGSELDNIKKLQEAYGLR